MSKRFLPAEWYPQSGVQLTWPHEETDWNYLLPQAQACFTNIAREITRREKLLAVTPQPEVVKQQLEAAGIDLASVLFAECPGNDTWARDHAPLTVIENGTPVLLNFQFNGWGLKYPACLDNRITDRLLALRLLHGKEENRMDFVFEGGAIESNGEGILLTTASCLMDVNRNGHIPAAQIEAYLLTAFGADRLLWLQHGSLEGDDTGGHIDTLARFCSRDTIAYVQCTDANDTHYAELRAMEEELQAFRTPEGLPFRLLPLPLPEAVFEDGRRLPATYANFLIINGAVLYPTYNQPGNDGLAGTVLQTAFPHYEIIGIDCEALIRQNGSLHCVTMQYPKGVL